MTRQLHWWQSDTNQDGATDEVCLLVYIYTITDLWKLSPVSPQLERVQRISPEAIGREQSSQIEKTKGSEHNIAGEEKKEKKEKKVDEIVSFLFYFRFGKLSWTFKRWSKQGKIETVFTEVILHSPLQRPVISMNWPLTEKWTRASVHPRCCGLWRKPPGKRKRRVWRLTTFYFGAWINTLSLFSTSASTVLRWVK